MPPEGQEEGQHTHEGWQKMHHCKSTLCPITFSLATSHLNQITSANITHLVYTRFFQTTGCCHPDFMKQVHLCKRRVKHSCLSTVKQRNPVLATCGLKFPGLSWGTPPSSMLPYLRMLGIDHSMSRSSVEKCLHGTNAVGSSPRNTTLPLFSRSHMLH